MNAQSAVAVPRSNELRLGAVYLGEGRCAFRLWAPCSSHAAVEVYGPVPRVHELQDAGSGYWTGLLSDVAPGSRYKFHLGSGRVFPDPASRSQPDGVHGPSEVVATDFSWSDSGWHGVAIDEYVIYELHVGTFTTAGTFDGAIEQLLYLKELGITAVEVMPVAQFPGARNWGYDGVYPFAVQHSYGGALGFKRFIDAAHRIGIAVVLDVVYNHLGPEGNYLGQYGPYFTDRYRTPWGEAINFDGPGSAGVREYFTQNALQWVSEFHIDGLRLDAVHAIHDSSASHILTEIAEAVHTYAQDHERTINVIAESDLNEERIVLSGDLGGYGLDAQWSDDFHHAVHTLLTGERAGYYEDFGQIEDVAKALASGFVYSGQYSKHRGRCHGTECAHLPGRAFVVCVQNHDQIGNRMMGERLSHLVSFADLKLAAAVLLLSPYVPLLFMGQEYGETAPFLYFVSHSDPRLVEAVREGRKREFAAFAWRGEVPDAQEEQTFGACKLNPDLRREGGHATLLDWYRELLRLRRELPSLSRLNRQTAAVDIIGSGHTVALRRWSQHEEVVAAFHFGIETEVVTLPAQPGEWQRILDSAAEVFRGPGTDKSRLVQNADGRVELRLRPKQCVVLMYTSGHSNEDPA
ncbi:MAG TPA: malto-oligosyltrehalose trehalohydrolase [Terriglobales bacterium]